MLRRHDADDDFGVGERGGEIVCGRDGIRNLTAGKKSLVHVAVRDRFTDFGFVRPEPDAMRTFASENNGEARAPCSAADDCDLTHAVYCRSDLEFDPKRFSVPARMRRTFS